MRPLASPVTRSRSPSSSRSPNVGVRLCRNAASPKSRRDCSRRSAGMNAGMVARARVLEVAEGATFTDVIAGDQVPDRRRRRGRRAPDANRSGLRRSDHRAGWRRLSARHEASAEVFERSEEAPSVAPATRSGSPSPSRSAQRWQPRSFPRSRRRAGWPLPCAPAKAGAIALPVFSTKKKAPERPSLARDQVEVPVAVEVAEHRGPSRLPTS